MTGNQNKPLELVRGIVFDIQRYSLHDGPGLRTNVFLKGCALRCQWCSNPESQHAYPEIAFFEKTCFFCGDCVPVCAMEAIQLQDHHVTWNRSKCNLCNRCAEVCLAHSFSVIGKEMTAGAVVTEVLRDSAFYGGTGGLTLTGGEPALQVDFAEALLKLSKAEGLNTAIETCGAVAWQNLERLLPYLDLVLFDIKHINPERHQKFIGAGNATILENLRRTAQQNVNLVVRVPLIPNFNTDRTSLTAIAKFVLSLQVVHEIHVLSYHTLGKAKYHALGIPYPLEKDPPMKREEAEKWADIFREQSFNVVVGG